MEKLQIVRVENEHVQKANLQVGNNIISCSGASELNKKKIVKDAVTVNLSPSGAMTLTSCQVSPCYIKLPGSSRWQLLKFGTSIPVKPGVICSILPNKCWFKIITMSDSMEKDDYPPKRKCTKEQTIEPPDKKICLEVSQKLVTSHGDSSNEFQDIKNSKPIIAEKIVSSSGDSNNASTFAKDTNASLLEINQTIPSPISKIEGPSLLEGSTFTSQQDSKIKEEDAKNGEINNKSEHATRFSNNDTSPTKTKQDIVPSYVTKDNEAGVSTNIHLEKRRNKCIYADKCYRKNPCHKVQFSHPGDPDFEIIDERPECPYGVHCYRKNFEHKSKFKHSTVRRRRAPTPVRSTNGDDESIDEPSSEEESVDESEYEPSDYSSEENNTDCDDAETD